MPTSWKGTQNTKPLGAQATRSICLTVPVALWGQNGVSSDNECWHQNADPNRNRIDLLGFLLEDHNAAGSAQPANSANSFSIHTNNGTFGTDLVLGVVPQSTFQTYAASTHTWV